MLRIITSKSVGQAKKYYSEGLTREGYYNEGQELAGQWGGKAAQMLGLTGSVQKDAFQKLCDNLHPITGEPLTPRFKSNRRVGYDVNFNCPKSVTLAHVFLKDQRVFPAFCESVQLTMQEMERDAATRVRTQDRNGDCATHNLVWANFYHFTARPVDGIPDPHLHAHCFVFNTTWDEAERRWKAVQLGEIIHDVNYYQAVFHAHLAEKLQKLGYDIVPVKGSFEIAGMPGSLNKKFSRRADKIMAEARRRGLTTAAERDGLAALTREKKIKDLSLGELEPVWLARVSAEEKEALNRLAGPPRRAQEAGQALVPPGKLSVKLGTGLQRRVPDEVMLYQRSHEAVQFAIDHDFYQRSVVEERELLTDAMQWGYGRATMEGIREAIKDFPLIYRTLNGRKLTTTKEVLAEENRIIQRCINGKNTVAPMNQDWQIQDARLNDQQQAAVFHVLRSRDAMMGIVGKAGVGKTTVLKEIARGIEAGGGKVMAFAPTSAASRKVLREDGFCNADTVDKFLHSEFMQESARGAVLLVDEGGLMSARQTDRFLTLAGSLGCRVVVIGDTGQHHSVERGDAFRLLQTHGEIAVITIDKIVRQHGIYRRLVEEISERRYLNAFKTLEEMNAISEIPDYGQRYEAIAADYVNTVMAGKTALLVAPTHVECDLVTGTVRDRLKEKGKLKAGREWTVLRNLSWSPAEKRDCRHYAAGQVVKVVDNLKGFVRGEHLDVVAVDQEGVTVRRPDGQTRPLPLGKADKYSVFERETIEVCEGERIRITCNGRNPEGHELNNGNIYTVKRFTRDGGMVLENGWKLPRAFGHLAHGYTDTSHMSQSKSIDRIFVAQSALISSGAIDMNQFYVSLSRGRERVHVYTDDIEELREKVARVRERELATEMVAEREPEKVHRQEMELTL